MRKAVILFILGMVLVSMAPIAVSEEDQPPWTEENGDEQNIGEQGHGPHDDVSHYHEGAQNGEQLQNGQDE